MASSPPTESRMLCSYPPRRIPSPAVNAVSDDCTSFLSSSSATASVPSSPTRSSSSRRHRHSRPFICSCRCHTHRRRSPHHVLLFGLFLLSACLPTSHAVSCNSPTDENRLSPGELSTLSWSVSGIDTFVFNSLSATLYCMDASGPRAGEWRNITELFTNKGLEYPKGHYEFQLPHCGDLASRGAIRITAVRGDGAVKGHGEKPQAMADAPTAMGAMGSDDECFFVIRPQVSRMMPWPRPLLPEPTDESPPPPSFVTESKSATSPKPTTTQKDKKPPPKTTEKKTKTTTTSEDSSTDRAIFTAIETTGSSGSISSSGSSSDSGASNGSATKTTSPEKETPVTPNIQFSPSTTEMLSPTLSSKSWSSGYGGGDEWLTGSTSLPSMATPTPGVTTTSCVGAPWHGLGDRDNEPAKGTSSSKTIEAALGTIGGCALAVVLIAVLILRRRHQKRRVGMVPTDGYGRHLMSIGRRRRRRRNTISAIDTFNEKTDGAGDRGGMVPTNKKTKKGFWPNQRPAQGYFFQMEDEEDEAHDLGNGAVVDEKAAMSAEARSNSTMTRATAGNTPIPLSLLDTPVPLASETGSGRVLADFRASLVPISVPPPAAIANDLHPGVGVSGTTSARSPLLYHQHGSGSTDSSRMTYSMSSKHSQASSVVRKYWAASMAARAERLTQEGQSLQHAYQDAAGVLHNGGITVGGDRTPSFGRDEEDDEGSRDSESRMADILSLFTTSSAWGSRSQEQGATGSGTTSMERRAYRYTTDLSQSDGGTNSQWSLTHTGSSYYGHSLTRSMSRTCTCSSCAAHSFRSFDPRMGPPPPLPHGHPYYGHYPPPVPHPHDGMSVGECSTCSMMSEHYHDHPPHGPPYPYPPYPPHPHYHHGFDPYYEEYRHEHGEGVDSEGRSRHPSMFHPHTYQPPRSRRSYPDPHHQYRRSYPYDGQHYYQSSMLSRSNSIPSLTSSNDPFNTFDSTGDALLLDMGGSIAHERELVARRLEAEAAARMEERDPFSDGQRLSSGLHPLLLPIVALPSPSTSMSPSQMGSSGVEDRSRLYTGGEDTRKTVSSSTAVASSSSSSPPPPRVPPMLIQVSLPSPPPAAATNSSPTSSPLSSSTPMSLN